MKASELKAKWNKDIDKDTLMEAAMDEIRLTKKEGKSGNNI